MRDRSNKTGGKPKDPKGGYSLRVTGKRQAGCCNALFRCMTL